MESTGLVHFDLTLVFQIANTLLFFLVVYAVAKFFIRQSRSRKEAAERLRRIEEKLEKIERNSRN